MEILREKVLELYKVQDYYFTLYPLEEAHLKEERLLQKREDVLQFFESFKEDLNNSAEYNLLKGKALNCCEDFNKNALDCLTRCVKLDPKISEGWNQLGTCYWKNRQLEEAKNCFTSALNYERSKGTLRNLSMLLRQLNTQKEDKEMIMEESFKLAKEAIQCDVSDEESWVVLGNTYISKFFKVKQDYLFLEQALQAFNNADKDFSSFDYSLYFNKGMVHLYLQQYELALKSYSRASQLNPKFEESLEKKNEILKLLNFIQGMVDTKGKLKGRKLKQMLSNMNLDSELSYIVSKYPKSNYSLKSMENLKLGINTNDLLSCKVVGSYFADNSICFTFSAVDKSEQCFVVLVFNCANTWSVKVGDLISIPDPYLIRTEFTYNNKEYKFNLLRVLSPSTILVNRKPVKANDISSAQISFNNKA